MSVESHKYRKKPKKDQYYLRALNETIHLFNCDVSYNVNEGFLVREIEPFSSSFGLFNNSHIHISVNNSIVADNGKIINHYSKYVKTNSNIDVHYFNFICLMLFDKIFWCMYFKTYYC